MLLEDVLLPDRALDLVDLVGAVVALDDLVDLVGAVVALDDLVDLVGAVVALDDLVEVPLVFLVAYGADDLDLTAEELVARVLGEVALLE